MKTLLSLFDYTGNWSQPYKENGWTVVQIDIKLGIDILTYNYKALENVCGILAAIPCTDYANSGARHFAEKDKDGRTKASQKLVAKTKEIVDYFYYTGHLYFYAMENPRSRIHILNPWMQKPLLKFNPCDYALFDPNPDSSRYVKETWIWGKFMPLKEGKLKPFSNEYPGWKNMGGKSEKVKEARSITPLGFAYAFYNANCKSVNYDTLDLF